MRHAGRLFRNSRGIQKAQWGFTLVELLMALAVSAIIIVGTVAIFRILVVNTTSATSEAVANQQVHYVEYWISQDVVQAQSVRIGNLTTDRWDEENPYNSKAILRLYCDKLPQDETVNYYEIQA